jgi:hypothetical protein
MYGLGEARAVRTGSRVDFHAPTPCSRLLDIIDAGQWRATPVIPATPPLTSSIVELDRGGTQALLQMSSSPASCDGTITEPTKRSLALTGAERVRGKASALTFQCQPQDDEAKSVSFAGFYDGPGDLHVMVQAQLPGSTKGRHRLEGDSEMEVAVRHGGGTVLAAYRTLMEAARAQQAAADDESDAESDESDAELGALLGSGYHPGDSFTGTATISSVAPLRGTIALTGLVDDSGTKTLGLSLGFACA